MKILLHIVLTLFQVTTCREEFRDIPGHTMCMPDNVNATPNQWGVSETEKNDIVKQHNMLRGSIEPTATDLLTMVRVYTPLLLILWASLMKRYCIKYSSRCMYYVPIELSELLQHWSLILEVHIKMLIFHFKAKHELFLYSSLSWLNHNVLYFHLHMSPIVH